MSNLVAAYLAMYIAFCIWVHHEEIRPLSAIRASTAAELTGDAALLVAACAFWIPSLRSIPDSILLALYVGGCAALVVQVWLAAQKHAKDPDLSPRGKLFVALAGATLGLVITAPLLYWGWQAAVWRTYAETQPFAAADLLRLAWPASARG